MIKVYLDWNCITHCKDLYPKLKELLKLYNYVFICPYGIAHLRDVQTNHDANHLEYEKDLDLLTEISHGNMLHLKEGRLSMYNVTPREYLANPDIDFELIQDINIIPYYELRQRIRTKIGPQNIRSISIENDPTEVIPKINNLINDDIDSIFESYNSWGDNTLETKTRRIYYLLDIMGYKSEKKKSLSNIDTDALHIATGSICDYLISGDGNLCYKARALYDHVHCATKIMDPYTFMQEIPSIVEGCFNHERIPEVMKTNGIPTIKEDGAHYENLKYPLWGIFKRCLNAASLNSSQPTNKAYFVTGEQFLFYDELMPIANIASLVFPESERESFIEMYVQSFKQKNPIWGMKLLFDSENYLFTSEFKSLEGLPALEISYQQKNIDN